MSLLYWDGVLRGGAVALFLLLSWRFARDWRRSLTAKLGALVTLGGACYTLLIAVDGSWKFLNPYRITLHLGSLAAPGLFWLFAASWFDDEFELRWWHVALVVTMAVSGFTSNYLYFAGGQQTLMLALAWRAFSIVAIALALRAVVRGWANDLVEARRHVRVRIAVTSAIAIVWIVSAELWSQGWPPPLEWRVANAAGMLLLAAIIAGAVLGWRDPTLVAAAAKPVAPGPRSEFDDAPLLARLDADMRHERLYRQDGLTITAVAARLGVPEYRLRRAINQGLGARNFNAYLNGFRLDETRQALADPEQRDVPILTIALDAGFGSLAPFNRAFRDTEGCTPSEYRARN